LKNLYECYSWVHSHSKKKENLTKIVAVLDGGYKIEAKFPKVISVTGYPRDLRSFATHWQFGYEPKFTSIYRNIEKMKAGPEGMLRNSWQTKFWFRRGWGFSCAAKIEGGSGRNQRVVSYTGCVVGLVLQMHISTDGPRHR